MDTEAFRDFERAAHDRVAGGYHDFFEPVTGGAIASLLDAAGARAGCRICGSGSWGGRCPIMGRFVRGPGAKRGATAAGGRSC